MSYGKRLLAVFAALLLPLTLLTAPASADNTGGSGGERTNQLNQRYKANGYTSKYHLYAAGLDWSKPVGMMIYADGTGEFGLNNPNSDYLLSGPNGLVNVAKKHNMILLTPLSPDDCACWHEGDRQGYVKWLESLVTHIQGRYPIDDSRVALGGYSSGATLMASSWLPSGAADRTMTDGVAVMISYGSGPYGSNVNISPELKRNINLYWNVGDEDETGGYESSLRGHRWYTENGFKTKIDVIPGLKHNRRDFGVLMDRQISAHIPLVHLENGGPGFYLVNTMGKGSAIHYHYGRANDEVFVGDWNGDSVDTPSIRRGKTFHINNAAKGGDADYTFPYGKEGDVVLVGDWDGDGVDTFAVRRGREYHFKNSMSGGDADRVIIYGREEDEVVVGDWDGDGRDTIAVRRGKTYYVKNSISGGDADKVIHYGRPDDEVIVGDWNGNGVDTFAVRRGVAYYVKNSISGGDADQVVHYGRESDLAFSGDWNGNGKDTLGLRRV